MKRQIKRLVPSQKFGRRVHVSRSHGTSVVASLPQALSSLPGLLGAPMQSLGAQLRVEIPRRRRIAIALVIKVIRIA